MDAPAQLPALLPIHAAAWWLASGHGAALMSASTRGMPGRCN